MNTIKAVILAAGKGERLKTITRQLPKPMIEYQGKPILQHNIDLCKSYHIKELYINLHYLSEVITHYLGDGSAQGLSITYSQEEELLGTSGAVRRIADQYWSEKTDNHAPHFFVLYGDNISWFPLDKLLEKALSTDATAVIAFHYREDVSASGVAEFADDGRMLRFLEKPAPGQTISHWVNAGIYCLHPRILRDIPAGYSDFGRDVFPALLCKSESLYGVCLDTPVKAFDTIEMINQSRKSEYDT